MAEYYFEVADENPPIPSGPVDLVDQNEARRFALRYAGELLAGQRETFWSHDEWKMIVTNEDHVALFAISITSTDMPAVASAR